MAECTCLLKHQNGGVCNCLDNSDWDNWEEDYDDVDIETKEEEDTTKVTKKDDDWFVH